MADLPHIPWFTSDFLNAVVDLESSEIGVYAVILSLIADKGAPIDDDAAWLARRSGSNTRRINIILDKLEDLGKIERRNGVIGNKKMLALVRKRDGKSASASKAAKVRWNNWRAENKPQLPLDLPEPENQHPADYPEIIDPIISEISPLKSQDKSVLIDPINSPETQNSADPAMRMDIDSRARVSPEPIYTTNNQSKTLEVEGTKSADDRPLDFMGQFEAVCAAAGYCPTNVNAITKAQDYVKGWRNAGINFTEIVLPTIQRLIQDSPDATSSLARFDRQIRHEHAKLTAQTATGFKPAPPPAEPILTFDDEPAVAALIRPDMLRIMGPNLYASLAHRIILREIDGPNGKRILQVKARGGFSYFWDLDRPRMMAHLAQKHGLADAWGS